MVTWNTNVIIWGHMIFDDICLFQSKGWSLMVCEKKSSKLLEREKFHHSSAVPALRLLEFSWIFHIVFPCFPQQKFAPDSAQCPMVSMVSMAVSSTFSLCSSSWICRDLRPWDLAMERKDAISCCKSPWQPVWQPVPPVNRSPNPECVGHQAWNWDRWEGMLQCATLCVSAS